MPKKKTENGSDVYGDVYGKNLDALISKHEKQVRAALKVGKKPPNLTKAQIDALSPSTTKEVRKVKSLKKIVPNKLQKAHK